MRERYTLVERSRLVTAAELEHWPEAEGKTELVEGRVVQMSPVGPSHGVVVMRLGYLLEDHVRRRKLGVVFPEVGFILRLNPDTVRAPDMAFVRRERMPAPDARGFIKGPPDLAAEVLSPDDRPGEMRAKVTDYLDHGVPCVLVADPKRQTIVVSRPGQASTTLRGDDVLDLGDVIDGFRCEVRKIFE